MVYVLFRNPSIDKGKPGRKSQGEAFHWKGVVKGFLPNMLSIISTLALGSIALNDSYAVDSWYLDGWFTLCFTIHKIVVQTQKEYYFYSFADSGT